jgi:competence protein ComEC
MSTSNRQATPLARVWFINVGGGDCTLALDVATGRAVLVDCPSGYVQRVTRLLSQEGATLDTVIVTHWDLDHYGGASRLAVGLPVRRILYNHDTLFPDSSNPAGRIPTTLKNFLNVSDPDNVLGPASVGQTGGFGSVTWNILAPTHAELTQAYVAGKRNIASAVVDLKVQGFRILIGGDAVGATWKRLLGEVDLNADILRWPHHGADLAGDDSGDIRDRLLSAASPSYVIISTGSNNQHGHPSAEVVNQSASHASVLCTQVTPGCFGFLSRIDRQSLAARSAIAAITTPYCADTVYVEVQAGGFTINPPLGAHLARVQSWPHPLCQAAVLRSGSVASNAGSLS